MRQANRKLTIWLLRLPLWRYLLIYFVAWLASSYVVSYVATWTAHSEGLSGRGPFNSFTWHLAYAASLTFTVSAYGSRIWRRRL